MNSVITKTTSSGDNHFAELAVHTLPSFLHHCKYTKAHAFTQPQLSLLNNIPIDILEHNLHININEAELKHAKLITSVNTLLDTSFTLSELYQHYVILTRTQYTVVNFVNCLIIIEAVLTRFSDFDSSAPSHNEDTSLFKLNINDILLSDSLSFFQIETTTAHNVFNDVYKNAVFTNSILDKIVIMIFSVNMGGLFKCDNFTYDVFINNVCLYNRVYFSHASFSLFVHLCFVVYCNLYVLNCNSNSHSHNKHSVKDAGDINNDYADNNIEFLDQTKPSRNNGNIYAKVYDNGIKNISLFKKRKSYNGTGFAMQLQNTNNSMNNSNSNSMQHSNINTNTSNMRNTHSDMNNNINSVRSSHNRNNHSSSRGKPVILNNEQCYLLDNDIISFPYTETITTLMFQSYLKLYLFAHISCKKIKCTVSLTIQNPITLLKSTMNPLLSATSHLFISVDPLFKELSLSKTPLISKQSLLSAFKSVSFKQLSFHFIAFNTLEQLHMKLSTYEALFQKATSLHIQEPLDIAETTSVGASNRGKWSHVHDDNYMNIEMMFLQWKILNYLIDIIYKSKDIRCSKKLISFAFKFNCFKFSLNKQTKDITLYFNY